MKRVLFFVVLLLLTATNAVGQSLHANKILLDSGAKAITIQPPQSSWSSWQLTLPTNPGTVGYFLETDGMGITSWQPASCCVTSVFGLTGAVGNLTGDVTSSGVATSVVKILGNTIPVNASGVLTNNGSGVLTWGSGGTPANPTATIGTSAVNGSATTYMRSDAAPAFGNLTGDVTSTGMATTYNNIVPLLKGGTGASTQAAALKNLTPDTTGKTTDNLTVLAGGGIGWKADSAVVRLIDFDSVYKTKDTSWTPSVVASTTRPLTPTFKYIVHAADIPTNADVIDWMACVSIGGYGVDTLSDGLVFSISVNSIDSSAGSYEYLYANYKYWSFGGYVPQKAITTNDTVQVYLWAPAPVYDTRYATITIVPRTFKHPGNNGEVAQTLGIPDTVNGAVAGVTYETENGSFLPYGAVDNNAGLVEPYDPFGTPLISGTFLRGQNIAVQNLGFAEPKYSNIDTIKNLISMQPQRYIRTESMSGNVYGGGGAGTVTSITASAPLTGGMITTSGSIGLGTVPVANGGTNLTSVGANGTVLTVVTGAPVWQAPSVSPYFKFTPTTPTTPPVTVGSGNWWIQFGDSNYIDNTFYGLTPDGSNLLLGGQSHFSPRDADGANTENNSNVVLFNATATAGDETALNTNQGGMHVPTGHFLNNNPSSDTIYTGAQRGTGSNSANFVAGLDVTTGKGSGGFGEQTFVWDGTAGTSSLAMNGHADGEYDLDENQPGYSSGQDNLGGNGAVRFASQSTNLHNGAGQALISKGTDLYTSGTAIGAVASQLTGLGSLILGSQYGGVGAVFETGHIKANGTRENWLGNYNTPSAANVGDTNNITPQHNDVLFGIGNGSTDTTRGNALTLAYDSTFTYCGKTWVSRGNSTIDPAAITPGPNGYVLTANGLSSAPTWTSAGGGGVTSVGFATNASYLTVSGSPVITSGTLTANKTTGLTANQFVGTPNGSTGAADLRSIVAADLPTIPIAGGGTNVTSYTTGDILYASATNVLSKLAIGSSTQVLTVSGGIPAWQAPGGAYISNWFVAQSSPANAPYVQTASANQFSFGSYARVFGTSNYSTAIGMSLVTTGTNAIALQNCVIGSGNLGADADYAVSIGGGGYGEASGAGSTQIGGGALGGRNKAQGVDAIVIGGEANSSTLRSSACIGGENNLSAGQYAVLLGGHSNAAYASDGAIICGQADTIGTSGNNASQNSMILGGTNNHVLDAGFARGTSSVVLGGTGLVAADIYGVAMGQFNVEHDMSSPIGAFTASDIAISCGIGTSAGARADGWTITFDGWLSLTRGIAITAGSNKRLGSGTLSGGTLTVSNSTVTNNTKVFVQDRSTSTTNVGSLTVSGISSGTFTVTSTNVLDTSPFDYFLIEAQ